MKKWLPVGLLILAAAFYFLKKSPGRHEADVAVNATPGPIVSPSASPETDARPLPKSAVKLEAKDQRKLVVLQQILSSHNDNDPRMDSELTELSPTVKKAMTEYYSEIPAEKRNDRGTIVFLIGRAMNNKTDLDFLKSVMFEKPCLSLQDCSHHSEQSAGESEHLESINETTANYQQLNAVRACVSKYRSLMGETPPSQAMADQVISTLKEATQSPNPKVVSEAQNALRYLNR